MKLEVILLVKIVSGEYFIVNGFIQQQCKLEEIYVNEIREYH